jgi:hypothetical protein
MLKSILRVLTALVAVGAFVFAFSPPTGAVSPSQDACHAVNNASPAGNCGPFKLLERETFNEATAPVGTFSGCVDGSFACSGARGTPYYATLGAYPDGWDDTAGSGADGNSGPVPGTYRPSKAASVIKSSTGDGQLKVHMTYSAGRNSVAAMVPRKCENLRYGKFTERTRVTSLNRRFKMAHLRYSPKEIDYPEAGGSFGRDPISLFNHGFDEGSADVAGNAAWTGWHTYSLELTPGHEKAYYDGRLVFNRAADYPDVTDWILQNESALGVSSSYVSGAPASTDILTSWLTCYSWNG